MTKNVIYAVILILLYLIVLLSLAEFWEIEDIRFNFFIVVCLISIIAGIMRIRDWGFFLTLGLLIFAVSERTLPGIMPSFLDSDIVIFTFVTSVVGLLVGYMSYKYLRKLEAPKIAG